MASIIFIYIYFQVQASREAIRGKNEAVVYGSMTVVGQGLDRDWSLMIRGSEVRIRMYRGSTHLVVVAVGQPKTGCIRQYKVTEGFFFCCPVLFIT